MPLSKLTLLNEIFLKERKESCDTAMMGRRG